MFDYSLVGYNPYTYYNYGYYYPPFYGAPIANNQQYGQNSSPQTNNVSDVAFEGKSKTIESSASSQIQKKKGMSKGMKCLLAIVGTAAVAYGCVVGHRALNKPTFEVVQKNLSEILGKDLSKEETEKILSRYKNICNESKVEEYLNKLFAEVKKDCGYENLDLALKIEKLKDGSFKTFKEHSKNGSAGCVNKKITLYPQTSNDIISPKNRRTLFGTTWHEFKHVKQCEQAYRTDANALVDAFVENLEKNYPEFIEETMKENKYTRGEALKDIHEEIGKNLESLFGKYEKYAKGTPEYEKGLKYIENQRNYTNKGSEYANQLVEREAFEVGDKARSIFDYLANPFKIF